jgi:hypothetical protein
MRPSEIAVTPNPATKANQRVGWVERSDTHQLHFVEVMGPRAQPILRIGNKTAQVICPSGGLLRGVSSPPLQKYFCFHAPQIISGTLRIPPHKKAARRSESEKPARLGGPIF